MNDKAKNLGAFLVPLAIVMAGIMVAGAIFATTKNGEETTTPEEQVSGEETTPEEDPMDVSFYYKENAEIYTEDGKVVVALISTPTCPHCIWVKDTYDDLAREYNEGGKVKAYHFDFTQSGADDLLTEEVETEMPAKLSELNAAYSGGYVPTFIIGGKYYRVGNAYEREDDLVKEEEELRRIIDKAIAEAAL